MWRPDRSCLKQIASLDFFRPYFYISLCLVCRWTYSWNPRSDLSVCSLSCLLLLIADSREVLLSRSLLLTDVRLLLAVNVTFSITLRSSEDVTSCRLVMTGFIGTSLQLYSIMTARNQWLPNSLHLRVSHLPLWRTKNGESLPNEFRWWFSHVLPF